VQVAIPERLTPSIARDASIPEAALHRRALASWLTDIDMPENAFPVCNVCADPFMCAPVSNDIGPL